MEEYPASSTGGRSNNDTNNEEGNRMAVPSVQRQDGFMGFPMIGNLGQSQGTVNPTSTFGFPGVAALPSDSVRLQSLLEMYQRPPFSSLSLEQIATALMHGSGSSTQTTAIQGLVSRTSGGVYSNIPLQRLEHAALTRPNLANNSANQAAATNPPSLNNQGPHLTSEAVQNSASIRKSDNQVAPSTEPNQLNYTRVLYIHQDEENLSKYQCLLRQHIEIFQASEDDLSEKSQGRNRPIVLGQVGIRCRHCGTIPAEERAKGGKFFPSNLGALYQTAQNLANSHLLFNCTEIPAAVREDMLRLRSHDKSSKTCKSAYGSGRTYWSTCLRVLGVIDTEDRRLFFLKTLGQKKPSPPHWNNSRNPG